MWDISPHMPVLTGIPPHTSILNEMMELRPRVDALPNLLKEALREDLDHCTELVLGFNIEALVDRATADNGKLFTQVGKDGEEASVRGWEKKGRGE